MKHLLRLLGLLLASACLANVIRVPEDYGTLQLAYSHSSNFDSISIGLGTHIIDQNIIIDHSISFIGRVVVQNGIATQPLIISNLSWYNPSLSDIDQQWQEDSRILFDQLDFTSNNLSPGLYFSFHFIKTFTIRNCKIYNMNNPMNIYNCKHIIVDNVKLEDVTGDLALSGDGTDQSTLNVSNTLIDGHYSDWGIILGDRPVGEVNIDKCIFTGISGAYDFRLAGHGSVTNSIFTNCSVRFNNSYLILTAGNFQFTNNIIFSCNFHHINCCLVKCYNSNNNVVTTFSNNCIEFGNQYLCEGDQDDQINYLSGNITDNPLLDLSYHLLLGSPCIDAGDPSSPLDPDGTRADIGAYYYCQGEGIHLPEILRVSAEPGHPEQLTATLQSTCEPVVIDSARTTTGAFSLVNWPSQIAADYSSGAFRLSFNPTAQGLYADTLLIWADTSPPLHRVPLVGEAGPIPAPVVDLAIAIQPDLSARLTWSPVTQTIYGNPVVPDYYLVFHNELDPQDETDWYYQGAVAAPPYTHFMAARFATLMNYRVVAWKGLDPALLGWKAGMRMSALHDLAGMRQ